MEEAFEHLSLKKMFKSKKAQAQTGGLITGLIFGIASLVIAVIIAFIITSTLLSAGFFDNARDGTSQTGVNTITVVNETGAFFGNYTLGGSSCSVSEASNTSSTFITTGNYTVDSSICKIYCDGCTVGNNTIWVINSTTTYYGVEEFSARDLGSNFTKGVDNISSKIPTILLIAAIVLILGVLVLLVGAWQRMRIGGGSL